MAILLSQDITLSHYLPTSTSFRDGQGATSLSGFNEGADFPCVELAPRGPVGLAG